MKKFGRRLLSWLVSLFLILLTTIIFILIKYLFEDNSKWITILLSLLTQIINLSSSFLLKKLTKFEKYSTKSKEIFSDIRKYFWLNIYYQ